MSSVVLRPWISQDQLETVEEMLLYLDACLEEDDPQLLAYALGVIVKALTSRRHAKPTG